MARERARRRRRLAVQIVTFTKCTSWFSSFGHIRVPLTILFCPPRQLAPRYIITSIDCNHWSFRFYESIMSRVPQQRRQAPPPSIGRGGKSNKFVPQDDESSGYSSYDDEDDDDDDHQNAESDEDEEEDEEDKDDDEEDEYDEEDDHNDSSGDNDEDEDEGSDSDDAPEEVVSSKKTQQKKSVESTSKSTTNKSAQPMKINPNVPLFRLLAKQQQQQQQQQLEEDNGYDNSRSRKRKLNSSQRQELYRNSRGDGDDEDVFGDSDDEDQPQKKKNKHAPAEMRSDKPVRRFDFCFVDSLVCSTCDYLCLFLFRLRVDANSHQPKFNDPRFLEYTGELSHQHYSKNFEFLDQMRENEVQFLSKKLRKAKGAKKERISQELNTLKQQLNERKLGKKVMERIEAFKKEDREKIKQGVKHTPYFLKKSDKKRLMAEEKYAQLKSTGKVNRYLQKKERKQQAAINQSIPMRRGMDE